MDKLPIVLKVTSHNNLDSLFVSIKKLTIKTLRIIRIILYNWAVHILLVCIEYKSVSRFFFSRRLPDVLIPSWLVHVRSLFADRSFFEVASWPICSAIKNFFSSSVFVKWFLSFENSCSISLCSARSSLKVVVSLWIFPFSLVIHCLQFQASSALHKSNVDFFKDIFVSFRSSCNPRMYWSASELALCNSVDSHSLSTNILCIVAWFPHCLS